MAMTGAVLRAYKTGWQQGVRQAGYLADIRPGCSELAAICLMNEFNRYKRSRKKTARRVSRKETGNSEWRALGA